jgi:hypothetical protein
MNMRQAIVWPLTTDQATFEPYYVFGEASKFPEILRRELQGHISDVLANLIFENQDTLKRARRFISYMPDKKGEDDTKYVVDTFVELSDALAEEIGNNDQLAQWRVRLFQSNAGVVAG